MVDVVAWLHMENPKGEESWYRSNPVDILYPDTQLRAFLGDALLEVDLQNIVVDHFQDLVLSNVVSVKVDIVLFEGVCRLTEVLCFGEEPCWRGA